MDVLSDVFQSVRLKGALYFDVRASEPLVAETPPMRDVGPLVMPEAEHVIPFHIMLAGSCWASAVGCDEPPARLSEGDIIVYPHGHGHAFATELGRRERTDLRRYERARGLPLPVMLDQDSGGPRKLRFVCGYLGCNASPFNPLLEALPSQLLARRPAEGNLIEVELIHSALEEARNARAGGETILARLSELLFVRVVRRYVEELPPEARGWLAGLRDPGVGRALRLLHGAPAREWTLESLAREAGMSRAVLAERFADHVGETPMRYLARWRMQRAATLLEEPGIAVEAVAEQVGYRSEAAFNRAFKNIVGVPPGAWRRGVRPVAADGPLDAAFPPMLEPV